MLTIQLPGLFIITLIGQQNHWETSLTTWNGHQYSLCYHVWVSLLIWFAPTLKFLIHCYSLLGRLDACT